jgi:putative FmdB family regulatory protein
MPLYEYQCETCEHRFEKIQKFSDPPPDACPKCGGPVRKLFSSPAIQFKGSGFYITDYAKKSAEGQSGSSEKSDSSEKQQEKKDKSESGSAKSDSGSTKTDSGSGGKSDSGSSSPGDSAPASTTKSKPE